MKKELIAPCGMNCAVCGAYLALHYDVKSKGIRMPYCRGCRPRDKKCAYLKKRCTLLLHDRITFCYECRDFPCERLRRIDNRYQTYFHTSFIHNLEFIRKHGVQKFMNWQKHEWQCKTCGELICCHNGICFNCNLDNLKKRKNLYRWDEHPAS